MSIESDIKNRVIWLRDALDNIAKLSLNDSESDIANRAGAINKWLLRMMETHDMAAQYSMWYDNRSDFSRFSEIVASSHFADGGETGEEGNQLAIACANIIHFQNELRELFDKWSAGKDGDGNSGKDGSSTAPLRRNHGRNAARAANIPTFLHITY